MIVSEFFDEVNDAYRGTDDDAPVTDTSDWDYWLRVTNRKIRELYRDGKNKSKARFEIRELGTIADGTQVYDIDDDFLLPSDKVIVTTTDGHDVEYTLVDPAERGTVSRSAYISGQDSETLTFYDDIDSTSQVVGGTIKLPGFFMPDALTGEDDTIPVSNTEWLLYEVAADLAGNDLTYESKAPDLQTKANAQYSLMAHNNRRGTNGNPRIARTDVSRIRGF